MGRFRAPHGGAKVNFNWGREILVGEKLRQWRERSQGSEGWGTGRRGLLSSGYGTREGVRK